jgi:hypothetical protein
MARRLEHKWDGYYQIRSAPKLVRELERRAKTIAAACNRESGSDGYRTSSMQGARRPFGRWRATVITARAEAQRHNAKTQALLKHLQDG